MLSPSLELLDRGTQCAARKRGIAAVELHIQEAWFAERTECFVKVGLTSIPRRVLPVPVGRKEQGVPIFAYKTRLPLKKNQVLLVSLGRPTVLRGNFFKGERFGCQPLTKNSGRKHVAVGRSRQHEDPEPPLCMLRAWVVQEPQYESTGLAAAGR